MSSKLVESVSTVGFGENTVQPVDDQYFTDGQLEDYARADHQHPLSQSLQNKFAYDLGRRNLIQNGGMQVNQRGVTSTAGVTTFVFPVDRFIFTANTLGTWTCSQDNSYPTDIGVYKSLKVENTVSDASPAAADYALIRHQIEGQMLQRLMWGATKALPATLSFWVKSNQINTPFIVEIEIFDGVNSKMISKSFTVDNIGFGWEKKTWTISEFPGTFIVANNNTGMAIHWWLAAGSNYSSTALATAWTTKLDSSRATGVGNFASAGAYFQLAGVQLEVGSTATPFEVRAYNEDLFDCMRYLQIFTSVDGGVFTRFGAGYTTSGTAGFAWTPLMVPMRITPTATYTTAAGFGVSTGGATIACNALSQDLQGSSPREINTTIGVAVGLGAAGAPLALFANNNNTAMITCSAEI